jgi:hypothetical protein
MGCGKPEPASSKTQIAAFATSDACVRCNRDTSGEMMWPDKGDNDLCQECWEAECSRSWWQMVNAINALYHQEQRKSANETELSHRWRERAFRRSTTVS